MSNLNIKLYPLPPNINDVKISKGDKYTIITGERLEQLQHAKLNGKKAIVIGHNSVNIPAVNLAGNFNTSFPNQGRSVNPNQYQNRNQNRAVTNNQFQNLNLNLNQNQRATFFEDPNAKQTADTVEY